MKKIAKTLLLTGVLSLTAVLAACGSSNGSDNPNTSNGGNVSTSKNTSGNPVVTFRLNYAVGEADIYNQVEVKKNGFVTRPATDPTREGYIFNGWYEDDSGRFEFEFEDTPITKDTKIFADWLKQLKVTFDLNYAGAPAATVADVIEKQAVARPADPTREGYQFIGWTVNKTTGANGYEEYFDFERHLKDDTTLYAKWGNVGSPKAFRFEAEFCDVITKGMGMKGNTYSGSTQGKALIQLDDNATNVNASNGYFVHFLYAQDNNLKFEINSDAAGTAKITMRLSAEYKVKFSINGLISDEGDPDNLDDDNAKYTIKVNGDSIDYGTITFTDVPLQGQGWKPFTDYLLTASVPLVAGKNTIEMITDNLVKLYGTAVSTAPMIDCLTFETSCNLNWLNAKASQVD